MNFMYPDCLHVILEVFLSCYFFGWGGKIAEYHTQEAIFFLAKNIPETIQREREREREHFRACERAR